MALATSKRIGELLALSRVAPFSGDDLMLSYLPFFVAKMENHANPLPCTVCLRSLPDFGHGLEEGSLLCPVRALGVSPAADMV